MGTATWQNLGIDEHERIFRELQKQFTGGSRSKSRGRGWDGLPPEVQQFVLMCEGEVKNQIVESVLTEVARRVQWP